MRRYLGLQIICILAFCLLGVRLFWWQVLARDRLYTIAQSQYQSTTTQIGERGLIYSQDGYPLTLNRQLHNLYLYTPNLDISQEELIAKLASVLDPSSVTLATQSAISIDEIRQVIRDRVNKPGKWLPIAKKLTPIQKDEVANLDIKALEFETYLSREYPESSLAAQLLGYLAQDTTGQVTGYYGLEGYYDYELTGRVGQITQTTDAFGQAVAQNSSETAIQSRNGRHIHTSLDRGLQFMVEESLKKSLEKYQAPAGEIIIIDPNNGQILAMAALPSYDPSSYERFDPKTYTIPGIFSTYEPGSTFKIFTAAAAIEAGVATPETVCNDPCAGPVTIGRYTINTWDNRYFPGQTIKHALAISDNTAMVYLSSIIGADRFVDAIKKFGFGSKTGVDLETESTPALKSRWGDIDVATASFGQGIAVTSLQMVRAVSAIANGGMLPTPHVVVEVEDNGTKLPVKIPSSQRVISQTTASLVTQMMIEAVNSGEAKWAIPKGYSIAGKTGTAQLPIAGQYDTEKTIASFIGFAPATNPKIAMLVKLESPQASPWASETAAPAWFNLLTQILPYLNIPPS